MTDENAMSLAERDYERALEAGTPSLPQGVGGLKQIAFRDQADTERSGYGVIEDGILGLAGKPEQVKAAYDRFVLEWQVDQLFLDDEQFRLVRADPDSRFLEWLAKRTTKIVWLSVKGRFWAAQHYPDAAMDLELNVWLPELMWAFKMRRHDDLVVSVQAALWYRMAMEDTAGWFKKVVRMYHERMSEDFEYAVSPLRKMSWKEVRDLDQINVDFTPCWLKLARIEPKTARVADLDIATLERARARSIEEYSRQRRRDVGERVAGLFVKTRPARLAGIIDAAMRAGWTPQKLVRAERHFAKLLFTHGVEDIDARGFGYTEFANWIASNPVLPSEDVAPEARALRVALRQESFLQGYRAVRTLVGEEFRRLEPELFDQECPWRLNEVIEEWGAEASAKGDFPESRGEREENWINLLKEMLAITERPHFGQRSPAMDRFRKERMLLAERDPNSLLDPAVRDHALIVHFHWFLLERERRAKAVAGRRKAD